jgi:MYXO-CTERM domain-containing protein
MKRLLAAAAALLALIPQRAEAACGPTYCPSYGIALHSCPWKSGIKCRVDPVKKDNPSFSELSMIFDQIAQGPAKYGTLGWNYTLDLTDGNNKPKVPSKVPAHFPCVLLKAISAHESIGWNQFCIPTGPDCPGYQRTIVACDCGYGLMQVTSGMNYGETSAYDANRVASDAGYNASVGSQIYAGKWMYGPSVGDRRVDVIEDWYFATWAYNGYAFVNNPNNPSYPADRKQYRDPGGLSAGNYPYQEKIWGLVRVPYGAKEGKGAGYPAYAINLPNRAQICASCGKPTADISDPPSPHITDCPGDGPVIPPMTSGYELSTKSDAADRFDDGASKGIGDRVEGDEYTVDLMIKNGADKTSPNVDLGVWIEEPYVKAVTWTIESNAKNPEFELNDADARMDQPPRENPGQALTFHMNAFAIGETKRIRLKVRASQYSLGLADHPDVRFWVKNVEGIYSKADFDSKPVNPSGQTWNGGDLRAWAQVDVFSKTKWTFDGGTLEGWTAASNAKATLDEAGKAMIVESTGDDPQVIGPETSFDASTYPTVHILGGGNLSAPLKVYFASKDKPDFDEARSVEATPSTTIADIFVDMTKNPAWQGTITRLRVDPAMGGTGSFTFRDIRMAGPGGQPVTPTPTPEGESGGDIKGGCGCNTTGRTSGGLAGLLLLGLAARRRVATNRARPHHSRNQ